MELWEKSSTNFPLHGTGENARTRLRVAFMLLCWKSELCLKKNQSDESIDWLMKAKKFLSELSEEVSQYLY